MRKLLLAAASALAILDCASAMADWDGGLPAVTTQNEAIQLQQSDKPVLLLIETDDCPGPCGQVDAILAEHARLHPDIKIVSLAVTKSKYQAPALVEIVGGIRTWEQDAPLSLNESNVDEFLDKRAAVGAQEKVLVDQVADLQKQRDAIAKPYNDRLADVSAREQAVIHDDEQKLFDLKKRLDATEKPYVDQINALHLKAQALIKMLDGEIDGLQAKAARGDSAANDEANVVRNKESVGTKQLLAQLVELQQKLSAAKMPIVTEIDTVSDDEERVSEPLIEQEDAIIASRETATAPISEKIDAVNDQLAKVIYADWPASVNQNSDQ